MALAFREVVGMTPHDPTPRNKAEAYLYAVWLSLGEKSNILYKPNLTEYSRVADRNGKLISVKSYSYCPTFFYSSGGSAIFVDCDIEQPEKRDFFRIIQGKLNTTVISYREEQNYIQSHAASIDSFLPEGYFPHDIRVLYRGLSSIRAEMMCIQKMVGYIVEDKGSHYYYSMEIILNKNYQRTVQRLMIYAVEKETGAIFLVEDGQIQQQIAMFV